MDTLEYHNNSNHTSTNYTPFELNDATDLVLIEKVKENINKNIDKKIIKNNELLLK